MDLVRSFVLLAFLGLAGCSNSGEDARFIDDQIGHFIDSAVSGLEYQSGNISGITASDGSFQYLEGQAVTFFIGDIILGEGIPSDEMSPLDLVSGSPDVSDDHVLNIARFLQTLDTDNDPSNGITISDFQREKR